MKNRRLVSILLFLGSMLFLLPNFYRNWWRAVEPDYYNEWQTRYDRLVVARLVKTRMDGFFSAGGLLGLGNTETWGFETAVHRAQFNTYLDGGEFETYLVYKSNPGFQAIGYSLFEEGSPFTGAQNLKILRGFTALASAAVFGLIITTLGLQFGLLPGLLTLLFTAFSMWIVLPAGSIFWNYWGFYLPFLASATLLAESARKQEYNSLKIHPILFSAALLKTLVSGFDLTTTVLVMATVPFVFHAIYHTWEFRTFFVRSVLAGIALVAGTLTGMAILLLQIIASEGSRTNAYEYLLNRFTSHLAGDYEYFTNQTVEVRKIGVWEVVPKYLLMPAIDIQVQNLNIQILYWHIIIVFALFTLISLFIHRRGNRFDIPRKTSALMAATWYSLLAPLSWYVTFRPHSFIHTHVNTMGWQMPFTLLGFALCGIVIRDLVLRVQSHQVRSALNAS